MTPPTQIQTQLETKREYKRESKVLKRNTRVPKAHPRRKEKKEKKKPTPGKLYIHPTRNLQSSGTNTLYSGIYRGIDHLDNRFLALACLAAEVLASSSSGSWNSLSSIVGRGTPKAVCMRELLRRLLLMACSRADGVS